MNRLQILPSLFVAIISSLLHGPVSAQQRVPWTQSRVTGSPEPPKPFHLERVYPKLTFKNPVELRAVPGEDRMLVMQVDGKFFLFDDDSDCSRAELILDIGAGLPSMRAFGFGLHPNFAENGQLFVVYSSDIQNVPDAARLSRFRVSQQNPIRIERSSEEILLTWTSGGHNGSTVQFDRQGLLYFSAGDGARPFPPDEFNVGQDLSDLRATICRIDVDHTEGDLPYRIPADNPFVDVPGARGEIWAFGFRNPWRFSIDPATDRLLCGDVGWEMWESVFDVTKGGNYGWSRFEGPGPLRQDVEPTTQPILKPLTAYSHSQGQSITGGFVYRGDDLPELQGSYLYGDYVSGLLWGLRYDGSEVTWNPVLAETGIPIITFAQSHRGEALVVSYEGSIYRLARNPMVDRPIPFPTKLSETGLFESVHDLAAAPGVYSYSLIADSYCGAVNKQFHVAIPDEATITVAKQKRQWKYPPGSVFVRTFSKPVQGGVARQRVKIETQLLHYDGMTWQPYSYRWNSTQDDADLIGAEGETRSLESLGLSDETWSTHSRAQCRSCHTLQAGGAVGFSLENLTDDAIEHFVDLGILSQTAPQSWALRKMVRPSDEKAELDDRARSYLAANCAHCHRRGGGGSVALDLEVSNPIESINAIGTMPMQGSFEIDQANVVLPGDPYRSVMLYRMGTTGVGRMPKLSHGDPDPDGIVLIHDWIKSMVAQQTPEPESRVSVALSDLVAVIRANQQEAGMRAARSSQANGDALVEGLFERFLPMSQRRKTLGPNVDRELILGIQGQPERGRQWLTESGGAQCVACHRVQGQGGSVGPSFDGIGGKRSPEELLESIINPSAKIDVQYQTLLVLTEDGSLLTGLSVAEDNATLTIRSADGRDHVIGKDHVTSQRMQSQSLMPSGQFEAMTARELADLIAFLSSLR